MPRKKNFKQSEETKKKVSESLKKYHAERKRGKSEKSGSTNQL